jgi:hypothetical protein
MLITECSENGSQDRSMRRVGRAALGIGLPAQPLPPAASPRPSRSFTPRARQPATRAAAMNG